MARITIFIVALLLAGCSYMDRLTGSTDDTVLPGSREDAIPGKRQFPDNSDAAPPPDAPLCKKGDPNCPPQTADGTFSDPQ